MRSILQKLNYWFILILVAYIPFYRLLQGLLETHSSLSLNFNFWLTHWYEPILILLLLTTALLLKRKWYKIEILIVVLIIISLGFSLTSSFGFGRILEGFRFVMLPLFLFLLTSFSGFEAKWQSKIVTVYLAIAVSAALLAVIERFLPLSYWANWGILNNQDFWYGAHQAGNFYQSVSFIGGSNLLASFLLPAFFFCLNTALDNKKIKTNVSKGAYLLIVALIFLAVILTFSRSAILGLLIGLILYLIVVFKRMRVVFTLLSLAIIFGIFGAYSFGGQGIRQFLEHGTSLALHFQALNDSLKEIANRFSSDFSTFLFGSGLGSAGPAAMKYGDGIISESWYLEIILQTGLAGLILWLVFWAKNLARAFRNKNLWLGFSILSVLITTAFLHTLSDNPALTFPLFIFLAFLWKEQEADAKKS